MSARNLGDHLRLNELYPQHFRVLHNAGLIFGQVPTLDQEIAKLTQDSAYVSKTKQRQKLRNSKRAIYFCIGHSKAWKEPIHSIIKRLKTHFGLTWLRTSMSYHRFCNLRELFQGDLSTKINLGITCKDFKTEPCNCISRKTKGCSYGDVCRQSIVVYKVECKTTGMIYIGNTQQKIQDQDAATLSRS